MPSETANHPPGRIVAIALGGLALIAVALVAWWSTRASNQPDPDDGRAVAEQFLERIQQGRPDEAWTATTAEFKSAQGKESFVRDVKSVPFLQQPLDYVSLQSVEIGSETRSEFLFRAKTGETVRIVVGRENEEWKVDRWLR